VKMGIVHNGMVVQQVPVYNNPTAIKK